VQEDNALRISSPNLRLAFRSLARAPRFAAIAVLPLALAIGATTALFSIFQGVLLAPLPYESPDRLVRILLITTTGREPWQSGPNLMEMKTRQTSLTALAGYAQTDAILSGDAEPRSIATAQVSDEFFPAMGARALLGRILLPEENEPGSTDVVVLSHTLWRTTFAGDPNVVGRTVVLDGATKEVVGVAEPGFRYPDNTELWTPLVYGPRIRSDNFRRGNFLAVVGRIREDASPEQVQVDLDRIYTDIETRFRSGARLLVVSLRDYTVGDLDRPMRMLLGVGLFVLLIACANVGNLLLGRGESRRIEYAVRKALGGTRRQIFAGIAADVALLAGSAGVIGYALASVAVGLTRRVAPAGIPRLGELMIDPLVMAASVAGCTLVAIAFGSLPALLYSRTTSAAALGSSGKGSGARGVLLRRALVSVEVALSLTLLTGAGLMLRSYIRLASVDTGLTAGEDVVAADLSLRHDRYQQPGATAALVAEIETNLSATPGAQSAAVSTGLPLEGTGNRMTFEIAGQPPLEPSDRPSMNIRSVTPGYFETLGIPVVGGAVFTAADGAGAPQVAVLSASAERQFFPDRSAIGQTIVIQGPGIAARVVAVVGDVHAASLATSPEPHLYLPLSQFPLGRLTVLTRTSRARETVDGGIAAAVREADPALAITNVRSIDEVVSSALARPRLTSRLLAAAAIVALTLSATGIFGVVAYQVSLRQREMGIRAALGAGPTGLVRELVLPAIAMIGVGSAMGIAGSLIVSRLMAAFLFEVGALDVAALLSALAVLFIAAFAAAVIPAVASARRSPAGLLREA
jgi:predicted permease